MTAGRLRAFRLAGSGAAAALDQLYVHADVRGVLEDDEAFIVWLATALPPMPATVQVTELATELANAVATGHEHDVPIRVGPDLLVRPPWVPRPTGFEGLELVVPRGMAFGSGEHASTQAALLCLQAAWPQEGVASFADVGTGSGILARYAQLRGCPRVCACDVEEPAVQAARELLPGAIVVLGGPEALPFAADCVVANLTAAELQHALPQILGHWTGRAPLVLSGMRADERRGVLARLPAVPCCELAVGPFHALAIKGLP